jgi:hypothetical protein
VDGVAPHIERNNMPIRSYSFDLVVEADTNILWGSGGADGIPQGLDEECKFVTEIVNEVLSSLDGMGVVKLFLRGIDH